MIKQITVILFLLVAFQYSFGQKVKIKKGTVYVNKKEFCKIKKEGSQMSVSYTFMNLMDDELVFAKMKTKGAMPYYHITFLESKKELDIKYKQLENFRKSFVKKLYNNNVIRSNTIDSSKLDRFILKYNEDIQHIPIQNQDVVIVNNNGGTPYQKVVRDTSASISVYATRIEQDFKTIGTIKNDLSNSSYYVGTTNIKIASVRFINNGVNSKAIITTTADNKIKTLDVTFVSRHREVSEYLVLRDYM